MKRSCCTDLRAAALDLWFRYISCVPHEPASLFTRHPFEKWLDVEVFIAFQGNGIQLRCHRVAAGADVFLTWVHPVQL